LHTGHKLHGLAEQALNWPGLPVVHVRPTVQLEGFFLILTPDSVGCAAVRQEECSHIHGVGKSGVSVCGWSHSI